MSIFDKQVLFSEDQAITATARSTNVLKVGPGDFGQAEYLPIHAIVTAAFNTLTSLNVKLQTDDDVAFGSPVDLWDSGTILLATLIAGYRFKIKVVPSGCEDYLSFLYTVTGTPPTTGTIFAGFTPDVQDSNMSF